MSEYKVIPSEEAQRLSVIFDKEVVVIVAIDHHHDLLHVTTFGARPVSKLYAAKLGDEIGVFVSGSNIQEVFEDFRVDAATIKFQIDALRTLRDNHVAGSPGGEGSLLDGIGKILSMEKRDEVPAG